MRLMGQGYELEVPFALEDIGPKATQSLMENFRAIYLRLYGRMTADLGVEVLNWRLAVAGPHPESSVEFALGNMSENVRKSRPAYFPETGLIETEVLARLSLKAGTTVQGPAIFEEPDTTVIVPPGWKATVDAYGNLIIDKQV
jgi:N-methylhydantoinase A